MYLESSSKAEFGEDVQEAGGVPWVDAFSFVIMCI